MSSNRSLTAATLGLVALVTACSPSSQPAAAPTQAAPASQPGASSNSATTAVAVQSPASASASVSPVAAASAAAASPVAAPSAAAPAAAAPVDNGSLTKVSAAYSERIANNLPLWYALETGLFKQHGLDVDLQLIASTNAISALVANQVQFTNGGGAEALSAVANGAGLSVIGSTCAVYPFVFEVPQSIQTLDQLKGQKVGVSNIGSSSDIATRAGLRKEGIQPDTDVSIVAVGSLQNRTAALLSGAIQGGVAQPPDTLVLEAQGFHPLFDLAALRLPSSQNSIVVQKSFVSDHRDTAQRFVDSIAEAIGKEKTDRATAIQVLKKYLQSEDDQAMNATYDFFVGEVIPDNPIPMPEQFGDDYEQLSARNPAVKNVDINTLLDQSLAKSSVDRGLGR